MNKHTQGPWHVDFGLIASGSFNNTKRIAVLVDQKQQPIDFPEVDLGEFEEELANARLIAAAPELLEACIEALRQLNATDCPVIPDGAMVRARLYSAIKKAKGE